MVRHGSGWSLLRCVASTPGACTRNHAALFFLRNRHSNTRNQRRHRYENRRRGSIRDWHFGYSRHRRSSPFAHHNFFSRMIRNTSRLFRRPHPQCRLVSLRVIYGEEKAPIDHDSVCVCVCVCVTRFFLFHKFSLSTHKLKTSSFN